MSKVGLDPDPKVQKALSAPSVKASKSVDICEITLDDDEKRSPERYLCPYSECQSESKNAQSIKVHLALVHYKKTIQAEFPDWKKQKCESCDKIFGQMTAYYLHMANHKKYKFMDCSPEDFKASNRRNIRGSPRTSTGPSTKVEKTLILKTETPAAPSRSRTTTLTPVNKIIKPSFSPSVRGPVRSNSFVQEVLKSSASGFTAVPRSASFVQSKSKFQQTVRTPPVPVMSPSVVSKTLTTPKMKGIY